MFRMEHKRDKNNQENPERKALLEKWESRWWYDGLNVSDIKVFRLIKI